MKFNNTNINPNEITLLFLKNKIITVDLLATYSKGSQNSYTEKYNIESDAQDRFEEILNELQDIGLTKISDTTYVLAKSISTMNFANNNLNIIFKDGESYTLAITEDVIDEISLAQILNQGGGEGTTDHSKLTNRTKADQHPISAITGLQESLTSNKEELDGLSTIVNDVVDNQIPAIETEIEEIKAGGGTSSSNNYGIKGDYSTHYGILKCQSGLVKTTVGSKRIVIPGGMELLMPGDDIKTTIMSDITYDVKSTQSFTLFLVSTGDCLEASDVYYQEAEPDNGTTNYLAWFNPKTQKWSFKSNATGNVWREAKATPIADIYVDGSNITRIDYIGYRVFNDTIYATKEELNTVSSSVATKQDALNEQQLLTVNSGITETNFNELNTEVETIKNDQETLGNDLGSLSNLVGDKSKLPYSAQSVTENIATIAENCENNKITTDNNLTLSSDNVLSLNKSIDITELSASPITLKAKKVNPIALNTTYAGTLKLATDYDVLDTICKQSTLAEGESLVVATITQATTTITLGLEKTSQGFNFYVDNGTKSNLVTFDTAIDRLYFTSAVIVGPAIYTITNFVPPVNGLSLGDILKNDSYQSVFLDKDNNDGIIKHFNIDDTNYKKQGIELRLGNYGTIAVANGYNDDNSGIIFNLPNGTLLNLSYDETNGLRLRKFDSINAGPNIFGSQNLFTFPVRGSDITDFNNLPLTEFSRNLFSIYDVPASATNQPDGNTTGGYCMWSGTRGGAHDQTKCEGSLTFYTLTGGIYINTFYKWTGSLTAKGWKKVQMTSV